MRQAEKLKSTRLLNSLVGKRDSAPGHHVNLLHCFFSPPGSRSDAATGAATNVGRRPPLPASPVAASTDVLGRYGGEEFVVLMPNTARDQALISAERLRLTLASTMIAPLTEPITVSIGAVEFVPGESGDALLRRMDEALYEAKRSGRNRVLAARTDQRTSR